MKKLLIVEDDLITAKVYQTILSREGYVVDLAVDGLQALEKITLCKPDGLLLDLMMPKMGGVELLTKLRTMEGYKTLPAIVYTNAYIPAMVEKAFQAGAMHVFDKANMTPKMVVEGFARMFCPVPAMV